MALRRPHWLALATGLVCTLPALGRLAPSLALRVPPDSIAVAQWSLAGALALFFILTLQLNQTRLAFWAPLLGASAWLWAAPQAMVPKLALWSLGLPLAAAFSLGPPEGSLLSLRSTVRALLVALPLAAAWAFQATDPLEFGRILAWRPSFAPELSLPYLSWALLLASALLAYAAWDARLEDSLWAMTGGLLGLLPSAWALGAGAGAEGTWPGLLAAHLALAAGLLVSVFFLYWGRVYLDELTALPNRRALDERLQRLSGAYALAMVDIDHFKKFNDTYGHEEGDNVLRLVAKHLHSHTGARSYRYGGEEFCAVFEGAETSLAYETMEATRETLAGRSFTIRLPAKIRKKTSEEDRGAMAGRGVKVSVTISIGIASPGPAHKTPQAVIQWADQGLYQAKEKGRNNVVQMGK